MPSVLLSNYELPPAAKAENHYVGDKIEFKKLIKISIPLIFVKVKLLALYFLNIYRYI